MDEQHAVPTLENDSVFKRKDAPIAANTRMNPEDIMLTEVSQSQKDKCCMILHDGRSHTQRQKAGAGGWGQEMGTSV